MEPSGGDIKRNWRLQGTELKRPMANLKHLRVVRDSLKVRICQVE